MAVVNNDWAKVIFILQKTLKKGTSTADVLINFEKCFYKFSNRLCEIEKEDFGLKIGRKTITYVSKITGKSKHYTQYKCLNTLLELANIFKKVNDNGLKK